MAESLMALYKSPQAAQKKFEQISPLKMSKVERRKEFMY